MNINKKYVIKRAESTHYCSGVLQWNPHIEKALTFGREDSALDFITTNNVTLDKGEKLLILPIYNTI